MPIDVTRGGRSQQSPDNVLLRSVIARPLEERIRREITFADRMERDFPDLAERNKTIVVLDTKFEGGVDLARAAIVDMLAMLGEKEAAFRLARSKVEDVLVGSLKPDVVQYLLSVNESFGNPIHLVWPSRWDVIIDINLKFRKLPEYRGDSGGQIRTRARRDNPFRTDPRFEAKRAIERYIAEAKRRCDVKDSSQRINVDKTRLSNQYVFARLEGRVVVKLAEIDRENGREWAAMEEFERHALAAREQEKTPEVEGGDVVVEPSDPRLYRAIYQIWPDFDLHSCTYRSVRTVKADAAQNSFSAYGEGITWAVVDSGIDQRHPHFSLHSNIDADSPFHHDFTGAANPDPLSDLKGHGTHVAGIIAGQQIATAVPEAGPKAPYDAAWRLSSVQRERKDGGIGDVDVSTVPKNLSAIAGIAPKSKLISLKVLDQFGNGKASNVIAAIAHIQLINGHGRDLKIHGVNLSLGHGFDAKWFACGQSPLCIEVNRLVKSGVVVVVAAGNTGYGVLKSLEGDRNSGLGLSINDPGNADLAITVGATHRDSPHMYGVSYFSSKGPTGDGRLKPDLIAPGERIVSAAAAGSRLLAEFGGDAQYAYCESSGTSMAAPHVSGAIAAFLSIRNEFIGEAEKVKKIFTSTATDLGRERYFQGAGLVDLLRAIQSV
jgi:serine protease AprX